MTNVHTFPLRIYFEDTDAGGIVYYANYLKFAERARTEFMRSLGWDHSSLMKENGNMFVVRTCTLSCIAPAYLDDLVEVRTHCTEQGGASLTLVQEVFRGNTLITTLDVLLAYVNGKGKPTRLDSGLRTALSNFDSEGS